MNTRDIGPGEPLTWWRDLASLRAPDFVIGSPANPYLRRWFLVPRNPIANVYLHQFLRSDDDRALHDHPWDSVSTILEGQYLEHIRGDLPGPHLRRPGQVIQRLASDAHRVELLNDDAGAEMPCWSLFTTSRRVRDWGFHCPHGFRRWQDFTAADNPGAVGRGCE